MLLCSNRGTRNAERFPADTCSGTNNFPVGHEGEHVGAVKNRARWMYKLAEIIVKSWLIVALRHGDE